VGRAAFEQRARALTSQLFEGLGKLPGIKVWTSPDPALRHAVVSLAPAAFAAGTLASALYTNDRVALATRGGRDRPGLRASPHLYNSPAEIDRLLAALAKYLKTGP
jgi:selenocysteine lyase/cysteine desulfurase